MSIGLTRDEYDTEIAEFQQQITALQTENAALKERIVKLEAVAEAANEIATWRTRNAILDSNDRTLIKALRAAGYGGGK